MNLSLEALIGLIYLALYLALMVPIPFIVTISVPIAVLVKLRSLRRHASPGQNRVGPTSREMLIGAVAWLLISTFVLYMGIGFGMGLGHGVLDESVPQLAPLLMLLAMVSAHFGVGWYYLHRLETKYRRS